MISGDWRIYAGAGIDVTLIFMALPVSHGDTTLAAVCVSRIERIAAGDLTMADEPTACSEIGRLSHLQQMACAATNGRGGASGRRKFIEAPAKLPPVNTDLVFRTEQQAVATEQTAASAEQQLTHR